MATTRKLIDLTGAPFIVEKGEDGQYYIIGVKLRFREFLFKNGIPEDVIEKITGTPGNDKIDGLEEIENFVKDFDENDSLSDFVPEEYVDDGEETDTWQQMLDGAAAPKEE